MRRNPFTARRTAALLVAGVAFYAYEIGDRGVLLLRDRRLAFRGIGLGRALLRHGLLELAARGAIDVGLGVDSKNPSGAVGLYERNGFEHTTSLRVFSIDF